jgi:outer membrane immunogenic protein
MKKILSVISMLALGTTAASAADLAPRYTKAPPSIMAAVYDWSGFYIGGNAGWGQANVCWDVDVGGLFTNDSCLNKPGAVVGGQAGYR